MVGCEISSLSFFFSLESDKRRSKWSSEHWLVEQEAPKEKLQWSGKRACNRFGIILWSSEFQKTVGRRGSQALDSCAMTIRIMTWAVEQESAKREAAPRWSLLRLLYRAIGCSSRDSRHTASQVHKRPQGATPTLDTGAAQPSWNRDNMPWLLNAMALFSFQNTSNLFTHA